MNGTASFPIPSGRLFSINDFSRGKSSSIFRLAERGLVFVVERDVPRYVILDTDEYRLMCEELEDERDRRLAMERLEKNEWKPLISWEDNLAASGLTRKDIDSAPEAAIL